LFRFVASKDCRCPITGQINDALLKLFERYDFVIFDCEFDLKYLNQLVDTDIDLALIIANPEVDSLNLVKRLEEFNAKYSAGGQLGVVLNKVSNADMPSVNNMAKEFDLDILGVIPFDENIKTNPMERNSDKVVEALKQFYFRLNLPQEGS